MTAPQARALRVACLRGMGSLRGTISGSARLFVQVKGEATQNTKTCMHTHFSPAEHGMTSHNAHEFVSCHRDFALPSLLSENFDFSSARMFQQQSHDMHPWARYTRPCAHNMITKTQFPEEFLPKPQLYVHKTKPRPHPPFMVCCFKRNQEKQARFGCNKPGSRREGKSAWRESRENDG
jgi:hypothetical protein